MTGPRDYARAAFWLAMIAGTVTFWLCVVARVGAWLGAHSCPA